MGKRKSARELEKQRLDFEKKERKEQARLLKAVEKNKREERIIIKRERRAGKYYNVARANGKFNSSSRWTRENNVSRAHRKYKRDNTLREGLRKQKRIKVFEVSTNTKNNRPIVRPPRTRKVQYSVTASFNGKIYNGRSRLRNTRDYASLREEAVNNVIGVIAYNEFNTSDDPAVIDSVASRTQIIDEKIIYFQNV